MNTLEREIEKARYSNYMNLMNVIKDHIIRNKVNNIDLYVSLVNGTIDKEAEDMITHYVNIGAVDRMFMPIVEYEVQ